MHEGNRNQIGPSKHVEVASWASFSPLSTSALEISFVTLYALPCPTKCERVTKEIANTPCSRALIKSIQESWIRRNERYEKFLPSEFSACGVNAKKFQTRIVGGRPADPSEYPWLAAMVRPASSGSGQFCGAALITEKHVLTAAHCVQP